MCFLPKYLPLFVYNIPKWWLKEDKLMTNLAISFSKNAIKKKLIKKGYEKLKKVTSYDLNFCVWLQRLKMWVICFINHIKKIHCLSQFLLIQTFSQNTDEIQTNFRVFSEKDCITDQKHFYRPLCHHCGSYENGCVEQQLPTF